MQNNLCAAIPILFAACMLLPADTLKYTYDSAGRLIGFSTGSGTSVAYAYDSNGNLLSRTVQAPGGAQPVITSLSVANGGTDIAQNTWIAIKGNNLVPASTPAAGVIWSNAPDFAAGMLPVQLGGVSVTVNGKPAFVYYFCSAATSQICASDQINVLTPLDSTVGPVAVVVTNPSASSAPFSVNLKAAVPTFLLFGSSNYIAATHADGSLLGPASLYPGASTPARQNEVVTLYAVGFGLPSTPLVNGSSTQTGSLSTNPVCQLAGTPATILFAGLIGPGLYQINLTVPGSAPSGDNRLVCAYGGASTPAGDLISVQ
jgi:uncharacterized protein (TIGR03437 family)